MQINFDSPKRVPSLKPKPEVDFRLNDIKCINCNFNSILISNTQTSVVPNRNFAKLFIFRKLFWL